MDEKYLEHTLKQHEEDIEKNTNDINEIRKDMQTDRIKQAETIVRLDNLCISVNNLTNAIKWTLAFAITTLVGFFMFVVQNSIF